MLTHVTSLAMRAWFPACVLALVLGAASLPGCADTDTWHEARRREDARRAEELATGTVTGSVTDSLTGRPLAWVQVRALGTRAGAQTAPDGGYHLLLVPPGRVSLRADGGWAEDDHVGRTDTVDVAAGTTMRHDFRLGRSSPTWTDSESVGVDVPDVVRHLHADVRILGRHFRAGDPLRYVVQIRYDGPDSIFLQTAVLGGRSGRRNPAAWVNATGSNWPRRGVRIDSDVIGSGPPLVEDDFQVLHRGDRVLAAMTADGDSVLEAGTLAGYPGMLHLEFHYRTTYGDVRAWLAHGQGRPSPRLSAILRRTPRVDLVAASDVWLER